MNETLQVLRALREACMAITEHEQDEHDTCRYCHAESKPADMDGNPVDTETAEQWTITHETWCPSFILDNAYAGLDQAMVDRVLAAVGD
jgi:hypothetical protein